MMICLEATYELRVLMQGGDPMSAVNLRERCRLVDYLGTSQKISDASDTAVSDTASAARTSSISAHCDSNTEVESAVWDTCRGVEEHPPSPCICALGHHYGRGQCCGRFTNAIAVRQTACDIDVSGNIIAPVVLEHSVIHVHGDSVSQITTFEVFVMQNVIF